MKGTSQPKTETDGERRDDPTEAKQSTGWGWRNKGSEEWEGWSETQRTVPKTPTMDQRT